MATFQSIADQLAALAALEKAPVSPNVVEPTFNISNIEPPTNVYVTTDDVVQVSGWNSAPSQRLVVTIRFLLSSGPTVLGQYSYNLPSNRSWFQFSIPLISGYMLAVTADLLPTSTFYAQRGQCFVYANIVRSGAVPQIEAFVLFSDYTSADFSPSWPSYTNQSSVSGLGALRSVVGTNPAPGANVKEVVPTNARWRFQSILFYLQTSAAAGNRVMNIYFNESTGITHFSYTSAYNQPASTLIGYSYALGLGAAQTTPVQGTIFTPLADLYADAGWNWQTNVIGIQPTDQINFGSYSVQEWINPGA